MTDIKALFLPKWGMAMVEGVICEWLISEGDAFVEGQDLCEIETSKIANVMEAPFDGILRRIIAQPGATVPVGSVIGISANAEASEADIDSFIAATSR